LLARQRTWRLLDGVSSSRIQWVLPARFPGWSLPPTYPHPPFTRCLFPRRTPGILTGMSSRCARCCWPSLPQVVVVVARFRSTSGLAQAIHAHPAEVTHDSIHMIATSWLAKALIARSWPLFDRPFTAPCTIGTCSGRDMDWDQGSSSVLFRSVYARSFFGYLPGCLEYIGRGAICSARTTKQQKGTLILVSTGIFEMYPILDPAPRRTRPLTWGLQWPLYLGNDRAKYIAQIAPKQKDPKGGPHG